MSAERMTAYTARQLFEEWVSRGLISRDQLGDLETFAGGLSRKDELPLYLHALLGIGAFIAAAFFILFLGAAELIKDDASLIIWGVLFVVAALAVAASQSDGSSPIGDSIATQLSFCLMVSGKIMFVAGFAIVSKPNEIWGANIGALLAAGATYFIYRMSLDRFLSALAVLVLVFCTIITEFSGDGATILLSAFFIAQLVAAAFLMTHGRVGRDAAPLAYAVIVSLGIEAAFFASQNVIGPWGHRYDFNPAAINIALAAALITLMGWAAGDLRRLTSQPLILAAGGAAVLAMVSMPGVLLAIGVMILGYARHDRLLLLLGVLLVPFFLYLYYYNLDLTLFAKSGILIASGAVLLAGWGYMHHHGFDREV